MASEALEFEQLLYGWSESNLFGRRGFGVVAASDGWRPLLSGGDDLLGPVVAYPEPGRRGAHPPAHGGFAVLRGTPVVFRRIPSGSDAFDRPGNYTVQVLFGRGFDLDAGMAAGLLSNSWLEASLPSAGAQLPVLTLAKPGSRRAGASAVACGAVLQGLREGRRVVVAAGSETEGRAAVCDAVRRLPGGLGARVTFSTLEAEPDRSGFDVAVAVSGWEVDGSGRGTLRVELASGAALDDDCRRWGEALAETSAASLRGIPEPVTVESLGLRLDALAALRDDPRQLSPQQLLSVLTSPEGQAWAAEPGAPAVARGIVAGMDPGLGPAFAKAAQRRPAVSALLSAVGWEVISGKSPGSRRAAEAMLLGLGEQQADIDMAALAGLPGEKFSREDSARYLRLLQQRSPVPADDPAIAKISWDDALIRAHPQIWFGALVGRSAYAGPRASRAVVESLDVKAVGAALTRVREQGVADKETARRLWRALPTAHGDRIAFLRLIAASSDAGLGIVFEEILGQSSIDPAVRAALLAEFWPILVHELRLPPYLATAMRPAGSGVQLSQRGRVVVSLLALVLVAVVVWGVWALVT